jgi:uncharacterized membrane protein HdeD (DUF308 family)
MNESLLDTKTELTGINKNWGWILTWGIALILLGLWAISAAALTTLITVIFLGSLAIMGGIIVIINAFQYWWNRWLGFAGHFIIGILYILLGFELLAGPVPGAFSLTLILAFAFILIGFYRIIFSAIYRFANWGWVFFSGLITLALGIMILAQLPNAGLYIIGLFIGIDLIFWGWSYVMMALFSRKMLKPQ